ncbi:ABC transporter permease [Pikeienuella sp. HZG-20]|uniref:ABC transporter permease n=1 Tax=Paludibacillus litoralis TaxID=3133267 RepID=UPI0030EF1C07
MTRAAQSRISLLVFVAMVVFWQTLSIVFPAEVVAGVPMIPGWQVLATTTFLSMADYWGGGFGIVSVAQGGERTAAAAALSIVSHSFDTLVRLYVGLALGAVGGAALGLAITWSKWTRRIIELPVEVLRTLPLLAMVPLFQLWFGTYFAGKIAFIGYGVAVLFVAGVINAVRNVPPIYLENARTLGASKLGIYRTVILPAIFPELRATIMLSLGLAWATVIGAEYLGAQSGLGYILVYAQSYGFVDRMFFVALLFVLYASISFALFNKISARMLRWAPRAPGHESPA